MSEGPPAGGAPRRSGWGEIWRTLAIPLVPGVALVAVTYSLWQYSAGREQAVRGALVESEAGRVAQELGRALDRRSAALADFAATRLEGAGVDLRAIETDFSRSGLPFRGLVRLDSALTVTGVTPASARLGPCLDARDDEGRAVALRVITEIPGRAPAAVSTAALPVGGRELLVCAPLLRGGRPYAFLVGVERLRDVLDEVLGRTVRQGFAVGVYEGPELVYGTRLGDGGPGISDFRQGDFVRDAVTWRVEIWPAEELARRLDTHAPAAVFALGMLLALSVSLCFYMWREEPARAAPEVEKGSTGIGSESGVSPGEP